TTDDKICTNLSYLEMRIYNFENKPPITMLQL
ncbi:MAG: hypothetical protein ACI9Q3_000998, partial [Maribacter sp.]